MESAKFEVDVDRNLRMLRVTGRGFWDEGTMAVYRQAVMRAMADLRALGGCRYLLIDMSEYPIQLKHIAEGHGALLRSTSEVPDMRVALVMQSALSKLQANRLAADSGHRTFDTVEAARHWLLSDRD